MVIHFPLEHRPGPSQAAATLADPAFLRLPPRQASLAHEALDVLRASVDKARSAHLPLMASFLDHAIRDAEQALAAIGAP